MIEMDELLYIKDCYMKEFDAEVIEVREDVNIILNQTAFYPNSGGQPNDLGKLICNDEEYNVVNVLKKEGKFVHVVDKPGLKINDKVHGKIDWERRYYFMRCHTASHVLSSIIHNETHAEITGNQIDFDKIRIDFALENFDRNLMKSFEEKTNKILSENHQLHFKILPREEAFKIPALVKLRKELPETITRIRTVEISDVDIQACGGTHVNNTSEIGKIEIFNLENKGKDRKRIYFKLV